MNVKMYGDIRDRLHDESLRGAILRRADLGGAILRRADLSGADLRGADLSWADLGGAILRRADLEGANLREADLREADLREADLREANLIEADLRGADLRGADLTGTVLDPQAPIRPLADEEILDAGLEIDGEWVLGWRTAKSVHVGRTEYAVQDEPYVAPWFSICAETNCHPGIYLAPRKWLGEFGYGYCTLVRCKCLRSELVHAKDKWRTKRLWIIQ